MLQKGSDVVVVMVLRASDVCIVCSIEVVKAGREEKGQ